MNLFTLFGRIAIDDKGATSKIDSITNTAKHSEGIIGGSFKKIGKYIGAAFTVKKMIEFEKKIISTYATYDDQMRKVAAVSGATGAEWDKLRNKARELGKGTRYSATEAGQAMENLARSGWTVEDIYNKTGDVLAYASANAIDLDTASRIAAGGLNQFGLTADELNRYLDITSATSASSAANVEGLSESFEASTPMVKTLNYSLEDMSLVFGVLADNEIQGAKAGTQLNSAFMRMSSGGDAVNTAIASLNEQTGINVSLFDEATGQARPLNDVLGDLRQAFSGLTEEEKMYYANQLFGQAGAKAMLPLLEATDEQYNKVADAIGNADGKTKEMQETMDGGLGGALAGVKSAWEEFLLAMGEIQEVVVIDALGLIEQALLKLPDVIKRINEGWQNMKEFVSEHATLFKALGIVVGILAGAFGIVIPVIELLTGVFGLLFTPVGLVVGIISVLAGLAYLVKENWQPISEFFSGLWEGIKNIFSTSLNFIKTLITTIWNAIKSVTSTVWNSIKNVITKVFNAIKSVIIKVWNTIKTVTSTVWNGIKAVITSIVNAIKSVITSVFNAIKTVVTRVWNGIKSVTSTVWNGIKSTITGIVNSIKSVVTSVFNAIKSTTTRIWNNVKTAMIKPVETAKNKIKSALDKIKGFFSRLRLKFPKIQMPKLPHFSLQGKFSLKDMTVPKLRVNWYKEGGILTKPTIFGMAGNNLLGGGEAGHEAVLPIEKLSDIIADILTKLGFSNTETRTDGGNVIVKVNIEEFTNNDSDMDIQDLIEQIQFEIERKLKSRGGTVNALV